MSVDRFREIRLGDVAEVRHTISAADVESFVRITGDDNPVHVDDAFAQSAGLGGRVVHGMLTASFISTVIGTRLPGPGALWYEQHVRFLRPVRAGETIRVRATVKQKSEAQRILVLETVVFDGQDRRVLEGEAKVKVLRPREEQEAVSIQEERKGAVVVSGGGRGIGAAIAGELAGAGYPVVVNYVQGEATARKVVQEIVAAGGQALPFQADVRDRKMVEGMVARAVAEYGGLAGVVNNACPRIVHREFGELTWPDFEPHVEVQLRGAFNMVQAALGAMLERQAGVVVNIASIFADGAPPTRVMPYTMAKAALVAFTRSLAVEYGPKGIRVNCVSPGMTETELLADVPERTRTVTRVQTPLRRLATPADIAGVVAFLFSDKAAHVTGQNLRVCGGLVMA